LYREPTLVAKTATTLDHISGGRAILGIGAAWNDEEAHDFGFAFGSGPPPAGTIFIRDDGDEADRVCRATFENNRTAPWNPHVGTPEDIARQLAPYVELGYRHLIPNFPAPYDGESVTRFATDVRRRLENIR
jgi:alkanesulfonate monooxygenase SsuD/methylene tetrahydromethanopterin reductase-like flavin-dependent oxidoreductase (luciferase family)